ncbi:hypothetical protein EVAR_19037_1 [Eumeta japonica]|uniref:Uncharacterized protein n=1 Tax=Eumeta variegata TaxID=151549 RepID=A0A4C1V836_EUMVA|nr:hypothetical protein EVAR_19037_1 [Eumeta japonica]
MHSKSGEFKDDIEMKTAEGGRQSADRLRAFPTAARITKRRNPNMVIENEIDIGIEREIARVEKRQTQDMDGEQYRSETNGEIGIHIENRNGVGIEDIARSLDIG